MITVRQALLTGAAALLVGLTGCDNQNNATPEENTARTTKTSEPQIGNREATPPERSPSTVPTTGRSDLGRNETRTPDMQGGTIDFSKMPAQTDAQIAQILIDLNQGEIDQANLALKTTKDDSVKKFAQSMVDEHTAWLKDVKDVAKKSKIDAEKGDISKKLEDQSDSVTKMLSSAKGTDFDRQYAMTQVKDHETAIALFDQRLMKDVKDKDLKKALDTVRPKLDMHLSMAKSMQNGLEKGAVGAKTQGDMNDMEKNPKPDMPNQQQKPQQQNPNQQGPGMQAPRGTPGTPGMTPTPQNPRPMTPGQQQQQEP
jgi:putative membrane protein